MEKLVGALMFGQSGGPTSVINASACGVFEEAFRHGCITAVYGLRHGIKGILNEEFVDMGAEDREQISLLKNTPSSALGSVRYKLADPDKDDKDFRKILEVFKKYNVRYFLYNGGNDSMDTCAKVSRYLKQQNYECRVMGVPKTIDNDLFGTDHCPGFGSAAKYLAVSCMEIYRDARVYDKGAITILEVMGRNAGWLTAATAVASYQGQGPDLIYLPEIPFDVNKFLADVKGVYQKSGNAIVAVSEGIRDKNGKYITEYAQDNMARDAFNHAQLGGCAAYLADVCKRETGAKVRAIEFSLLQRCAAHCASQTDVEEAYLAGATAVKSAVEGKSGLMVAFRRAESGSYKNETVLLPLDEVANKEKKVPAEYIGKDGNFIERSFLDYVTPLIQGEARPPFENGLPVFAKLKKQNAAKK